MTGYKTGYNKLERQAIQADEDELFLAQHLHVAAALLAALNDDMRMLGRPEIEMQMLLSACVIAVGRLTPDYNCITSYRAATVERDGRLVGLAS